MAYRPRIEFPGGTYHVNTKTVDGCRALRDEEDCSAFLLLLRDELERSRWTCLAYTLIGNHYHLLIRLADSGLSRGFQRLNADFARLFNRTHKRRGALWQRRFHDTLVESDPHLLETVRYIALNAPRANLCERPEDHPWGSYGAAIGEFPPDPLVAEDELLALFGTTPERARQRLREFVEEGDPRKRRAMLGR
jgi:REP element-mobilizing transposase RayT